MRFSLLLIVLSLCGAAHADRLVNTPRGGKLPYRTIRFEYLSEASARHNSYAYLGLGLTTKMDAEIRRESIEDFDDATTFDLNYNINAPLTDFAPGISFGVLDALRKTKDGRRYYVAITSKQASSDMLVGGDALELTLGFVVGSEDGAFVGMSLPFSEQFRFIVEHDAFRLTAGAEFKPYKGVAVRVLFRPNETLIGFQTRAQF